MKNIRIDNPNILFLVLSILILVAGISSVFLGLNPGFWHITGSAIGTAIITIFFAIDTLGQKRIIKLSVTSLKITLAYNKEGKKYIGVKDIESIDILVHKETSESFFPYQISVSLKEKSGFQNYFCVNKSNYDIVFQLYDAFTDIVPNVTIKATGQYANGIQADIDNYIEHKRRIPLLKRFWTSCNKREKIELILFLVIIFLPCVIITSFLFIKHNL